MMLRIGTSYSSSMVAAKAAEEAARSALEKAGCTRADTVLLFATAAHRRNYPEILKKVREVTGAKHIVGASGYGIITDQIEIERSSSLAVMVLASGGLECSSFLTANLQESSYQAGQAVGLQIREQMAEARLITLFPDIFSFHSPLFFDGFESESGFLPLLGGTAADNGRGEKTFQLCGNEVAYDAVSGIAFGGDFRVETGLTRSCSPFGESLQVTRAEGNMIYEMDGRPAYDIFLEYLTQIEGLHPDSQVSDQVLQRVFLGVPLRSYQTDFSNSDYMIRNIIGVNAKKGMLSCVSTVQEGDFVTFALRHPALAQEDLRRVLSDMRSRIHPKDVYGGFYFNSLTRGQSLYRDGTQDVEIIRKYFPGIPILGFFTYGEIAPVDYVNLLHHHTGVLVLLTRQG